MRSAEQSGPICDRGKPSRTTEFQIVEKGIPHWNQRTEVSRFRRRSEPSDVPLQKSKGNSVRATRRSSLRIFPQPLGPFSCPNNSEAIRSRGTAARFTLTNAREARSHRRWITRATSSLPVPVSPVKDRRIAWRDFGNAREHSLQSWRGSNNLLKDEGFVDLFA